MKYWIWFFWGGGDGGHHRLPMGRNRYMLPPFRDQIKMPRTKSCFVSGRIPGIRGATQIAPAQAAEASLRVRSYAWRYNGRSRQALLPAHGVRPALRSPFTRRPHRHSTLGGSLSSALCALLFFVLGFDVGIIAQTLPLVKGFLQLFLLRLAKTEIKSAPRVWGAEDHLIFSS